MQEILHLINEMSPYLLLGFLLAGILHAFLPPTYYRRFLGKGSFRSVINAALFGIPLPLCSCGVIPTAMSLRKEGASKGATVSFLIATPQTGVDSIIATYSLMGWPFAIIRPIAALFTSLLGGTLINFRDKEVNATTPSIQECPAPHSTIRQKCVEALKYGYVEMMEDIGKWLVAGLLIAALITLLVPEEWFVVFKGNTLASMLLVLLISMPMYVCATGSIPIAVALMMKGLTPGAALVLLMAGPACNFASMMVVRKVLGTKSTLLYLFSIIMGAIGFGVCVDYLHFSETIDFLGQLSAQQACCHQGDSWFAWSCTALLTCLLVNALVLPKIKHRSYIKHTTNMEKQVYHIEGMNCNHCRTSAEKALLAVEGVTHATVDLATKEAQVEGTASKEALAKAISEIGFTLK